MPHTFEFTIDGETFTATNQATTANQLMQLAGLSLGDHYLVRQTGKKQHSYEGKGDEAIHLSEGAVFITVFTGPTTVSDGGPQLGAVLFRSQLEALGYAVTDHGEGKLSIDYVVEIGPMEGKEVSHGFQVPADFPSTPPSGPHVKPHIHPVGHGGGHPRGGCHDSPFGKEWQYWSRPFPNWNRSRRNAADYIAFVRHLWATQ